MVKNKTLIPVFFCSHLSLAPSNVILLKESCQAIKIDSSDQSSYTPQAFSSCCECWHYTNSILR